MSQSDTQLQQFPFIQSEVITVNQGLKFKQRLVRNISQNTILTSDDSGILIQVTVPGVTLTLPETSLAYTYEITNEYDVGSFTIKPSPSDLIIGGGLAKTTQKASDGQEVVLNPGARGDSITLTGDGIDGWVTPSSFSYLSSLTYLTYLINFTHMSSIEQTNIPNPLVGPIVAPPIPDADQAPAAPVGLHAQHGDSINAEDEANLVSGTILPVSEAPIDENQANGTVVASDGVHYSGAKAKAIIEASKAQSAQAKKTKAAAVNKLQNHQATNTSKAAGASKTSSCPSGGEAQLNMIFSHLNGLAVKVDKIAKAQDKLLSHAEFTRDKVEEMVPHILEEPDDDYTEDEESDDDDDIDSDDSEEEDEEEDDDNENDNEEDEIEEAQEAPVTVKSSKRKGKGPAAQTAKKHKRVVIDDEISDREEEDSEIAVSQPKQ